MLPAATARGWILHRRSWLIVSTFKSTASIGGGAAAGALDGGARTIRPAPHTTHADHKTSVPTGNRPASCSVICEDEFNRSFKCATPSKLVSQSHVERPALPILRSADADARAAADLIDLVEKVDDVESKLDDVAVRAVGMERVYHIRY